MKIVVFAKLVPDLVEELTIDENGTALDSSWLRLIINEFDDHAIEQAILLKERGGGHVTVICPDYEGVDDVLFTAHAKGADRLIKVCGNFAGGVNNHALARAIKPIFEELSPDLIMTGVQANNDLDGSLGPLLAEYLQMPFIGYVSGVKINGEEATIIKEYPGGLTAELNVLLPAVLGIQSAEQPPRYVAISKVRLAMKAANIEEPEAANLDATGGPDEFKLSLPESAGRAKMIEGKPEEVAAQFIELFKELGVL